MTDDYSTALAKVTAERDQLRDALRAVKKLHSMEESVCANPLHTNHSATCPACADICDGCGEDWPCETRQALAGIEVDR